jgi:dihydroxy-acid dehydratase
MTDGRFSGGSHGFIVGHITPEAQDGGPIALVENGDVVTIDAEKNRIDVDLPDEQLADRAARWRRPPYKFTRGTLYKYIKNRQERQRRLCDGRVRPGDREIRSTKSERN